MKMIPGIKEKLGFWSENILNKWTSNENWLWFHAVSVGELNAVWPLVLEINKLKPEYPIMISTTTFNGYNLAIKLASNYNFLVIYFPFDFPWVVKSLLSKAKVKTLCIVETEIWPCLLNECKKRNIPIISKRISAEPKEDCEACQ